MSELTTEQRITPLLDSIEQAAVGEGAGTRSKAGAEQAPVIDPGDVSARMQIEAAQIAADKIRAACQKDVDQALRNQAEGEKLATWMVEEATKGAEYIRAHHASMAETSALVDHLAEKHKMPRKNGGAP